MLRLIMSYSSNRADHTVDMLLSMMSLFNLMHLPDELVAWYGILMIYWHISMMMFADEISICLYTIFLGKYTGFTARGYKDCFEMIFEKTLFLPTHAFVLRPSRY